MIKVIPQTILFHQKTFNPSIIPKGKRLKRAIHALKAAPHIKITERGNDDE